MNENRHHLIYRLFLGVSVGAFTLAFCFAVWAVLQYRTFTDPTVPTPPDLSSDDAVLQWPHATLFAAGDWSVIEVSNGSAVGAGPLADRFRLAGTFFAYPGEDRSIEGARHAILDDLKERRQRLVQEGDRFEQIEVVRIFRERLILRGAQGEEELRLIFADRAPPRAPSRASRESAEIPQPVTFEDMPALETNRFGKRIGDQRWVIERDALLQYAEEIQDDPERLTAFFMAMQPDLDHDQQTQGFTLEKLGEDALYEAAGFLNGDTVRMVNSMPMTSPARAEYFISEFLHGRISALVFDIERDGEDVKLIHLIR